MHAAEKNEDTWCSMLGHYDAEDRGTPADSPEIAQASRDGDMDGILYISDGDPNLLNANRNDNGRWLNAYYDRPDNRWNRNNGFAFAVAQLSSFLFLLFARRVLFL